MAKHLIVKTSSLGDIVHMLPAISDAVRKKQDCSFDWIVERSFAEIPAWHPQVNRSIPINTRKWRKKVFNRNTWQDVSAFRKLFTHHHYEKVIDSQGLVKSAFVSRMANGSSWGYDSRSIREPIASFFYQHKVSVPFKEHAVTRNRLMLSKSLGYSIDDLPLDYGIAGNEVFDLAFNALKKQIEIPKKYIVALHGTSRHAKQWPIDHWDRFIKAVEVKGYTVLLPWGNNDERTRAALLANQHNKTKLLPQCSLTTLAGLLQNAFAVIGMDTGLMHVAAAFGVKGVALYPATDTELTGVMSATNSIENVGGKMSLDVELVINKMLTLLRNVHGMTSTTITQDYCFRLDDLKT